MNLPIVDSEDGMNLIHHLFVNYVPCVDADFLFHKLMIIGIDPNKLTKFQESPLDLAIEHKTDALELVLRSYQYHDKFEFNNQNNSKQLSILHRAVFASNFLAVQKILNAACCYGINIDVSLRNYEGKLARDFLTQLVFLNKILKLAEIRIIRKQLESIPFLTNHKKFSIVRHTNVNNVARKG